MGTHLNRRQLQQLCDGTRTVYLGLRCRLQRQRPAGSAKPRQPSSASGAHDVALRLLARRPRSELMVRSGWRCAAVSIAAEGRSAMKFRVIDLGLQQLPKSGSRRRADHRPRWAGLTAIWIASTYAGWPTRVCDSMRSTYCTLSAGGQASIAPAMSWNEILTESTLLEYLRFQSGLQPRPSGSTINARIAVADARPSQRVPRRSLPVAPRIPSSLFAPLTNGLGRTALGNQPNPGQGIQAKHRAVIHR